MKFNEALLAAQQQNLAVLIPVRMGLFVKIRLAEKRYNSPSIPLALVEKYNLQEIDNNYECNVFEIDFTKSKPIEEIQDKWLQWSVSESDITRQSFMLI